MELPIISSKYDHVNAFINNLAPIVLDVYTKYKSSGKDVLLPSVVLAMGAQESGWNINASTLFGIKGDGFESYTTEYYNGQPETIIDSFKMYPDVASAVVGLFDLMQWENYKPATDCGDYVSQSHMVQVCGYATDPAYAVSIKAIIEDFGLAVFDEYIKEQTEQTEETEQSEEEPEQTEEPDEYATYTVQSGDCLWNIVKEHYGLDNDTDIANMVNAVATANNIENADLIYPNQTLILI